MTIQTINLTVPGGDTPRSANTKINANFTDQTHAASRLVGTAANQIPLAQDIRTVMHASPAVFYYSISASLDANSLLAGSRVVTGHGSNKLNVPVIAGVELWSIETKTQAISTGVNDQLLQIASSYRGVSVFLARILEGGVWSAWTPLSTNPKTYSTTTASGANVVVTTTGELQRSTSSERYKEILAPLELDDAKYADAMALKPIVYRSTADADNPAYHYYSFSAEELGAYDPAFTLWRDTETVTDEDGNTSEQPLEERQAEGININALLAMSHAIAIKQGKLIKDLQDQVIEKKEAIAALQQTNP